MRQDGVLAGYDPGSLFCEMLRPGQPPHSALSLLRERLRLLPVESLRRRAADAERDLLERGITFTVYSDATAIDRILPFDLIPRVITAQEWHTLEAGVIQRVRALNLFLHDIYHERKILADGVVPRELVLGNAAYCQAMIGFDPPLGTYVHVCGTDIIRDDTGRFLVLEDNARTPSGVAYVVENRHMTLRVLSDLMAGLRVRSVDEYGLQLHRAMTEIAPAGVSDPQVVLLSPGIFNSAYFEHVFLAREMGVPLVEGQDLLVEDGRVWMRTTAGLAPVHTIYRRLNDDFLDPDAFRPDSQLGVRGLIEAWRRGEVSIANAVGTGCRRRQGGLCLHAAHHPLLSRRGRDPAECRYAKLRRAGGAGVYTRASARAGGEAGGGIRRLRPADRPACQQGRAGRVPRPAEGQSGQLHQPADGEALGQPDAVR